MLFGYTDDILVYWQNEQSGRLPEAVTRLFFDHNSFNEGDRELIRNYMSHWVAFKGHVFEPESIRQDLLSSLQAATTFQDFLNINSILVSQYGIDPF